MIIKKVRARSILDSRKKPTIEVSINGNTASAPAGKSTGKAETPSYRKSLSWNIKAVNHLNLSELKIKEFSDLSLVEREIKRKFRLSDVKKFGANALVALEIAVLKALAKETNIPLFKVINPKAKKIPVPAGNAIGGGLHSHNKDKPTFQEFLLIPQGKSAKENVRIMQQAQEKLKDKIKAKRKNDEGAWQTPLQDEEIFEALSKIKKVRIGTDVASSSFYKNSSYKYRNKSLDRKTQTSYINSLIKKYNLLYTEDPLNEDDFSGFSKVRRSSQNLVVGDDLTATQISRLRMAIQRNSINAMIVKPNQNGSLLEVKKVCDICREHGIKTIISHRSGETLDHWLSDLAVGFQADYIKCGISTKWREAKLDRLIEIERMLN